MPRRANDLAIVPPVEAPADRNNSAKSSRLANLENSVVDAKRASRLRSRRAAVDVTFHVDWRNSRTGFCSVRNAGRSCVYAKLRRANRVFLVARRSKPRESTFDFREKQDSVHQQVTSLDWLSGTAIRLENWRRMELVTDQATSDFVALTV